MSDTIFVIAGSSGSGKTSIAEKVGELGCRIITSTTRPARPGEKDGIDYYFLSKEDFCSTNFVEKDTKYDNYYGTEVEEVNKKISKGSAYAILTHQGYVEFKRMYGDKVVGIFVYTSRKDIVKMLTLRGEKDIDKRMRDYDLDLKNMTEYDYVITNEFGKIEDSIESLKYISKMVKGVNTSI